MDKKYKLTEETLENNGHILYRIEALVDFNDVKKGDKGGCIETEYNLSQEGYCWIYDNAVVYDTARVCGNALVGHNAKVCDDAIVSGKAEVCDNAKVSGKAVVCDDAVVSGKAEVKDNAVVRDNAGVFGNAIVRDNAWVSGYAVVYGDTEVYGDAVVSGNAEVKGKSQIKISNGIVNEDDIQVVEVSVTYNQKGDCNDSHNYQQIRLTTRLEDAPVRDENFPFYINWEILPNADGELGHWSIDDTQDIVNIIEDFKRKVLAK